MGFLSGVLNIGKSVLGGLTGAGGSGVSGMIGSALGKFGLPLVGGLLGNKGQADANEANAALAQRQMDFQERMRNTSYQSAMEDMRKAGLNPILAYKQGGAAVPGGASAVMNNELSPAVSAFDSMANSAVSRKSLAKGMHKMQSEIDLQGHQINTQLDTQANLQAQNRLINAQVDRTKQEASSAKAIAEIDNAKARVMKYAEQELTTRSKLGADSPNMIRLERVMEAIGKIFGGSSSALDLMKGK